MVKNRTSWIIGIGFAVFTVVIIAFWGSISANAVVEYSDNDTIFSSRTKSDVAKKYSEGKYLGKLYEDGNEDTYYSDKASISNPYKEGALTDDTLKSMQGMTDFYRWLIGVDALKNNCTPNPSLQYQALDRNFEFNHYISNDSKPEDMSDELWQKGFNCQHNILAMGYTPQGAITGWMNEGYNLRSKSWDTLGHRYALIHPNHPDIQFGYCGRIAIGVYDYESGSDYKELFSAFPSAGYMPNNLVYPSVCAWAVDWKTEVLSFDSADDVLVTVTNDTTKESYTCKKSDSTISISAGHCSFVQPSDYTDYEYQDNYTVKITGLKDVATGQEASLTYHVKFFDVSEYADTYVKSVQPDGYSNLVIYQSMSDTESLQKIAAVLPDKVVAIGESGKKAIIPVKGKWVLDEDNMCYTNTADESALPDNMKDTRGVLNKIKVTYTISDDYYDAYNSLRINKSSVKEHDSGWMLVYRTHVSSEHSRVFKINESNGSYSGTLRFDSAIEYDTERSEGAYTYFNIDSFEVSDSGEYISVYFSDSDYYKNAYVSTSVADLTVSHDYNDTVIAPTCTQKGYTVHTCAICGDSHTDSEIDALGHNYVDTVKAPTCTEKGYTTHSCSRCDDTYTDSETDALGHNYISKVTNPSCTEDGFTTHTCDVCGDSYKDEYTESLGHDYKTVVTPATCTEYGYSTYHCDVCGKDYTLDGEVYKFDYTAMVEHSYTEYVTPPTCTEKGYTTHTCDGCGDSYTDNEVDPLGHNYKATVTPPTYTDNGYTTYTCERCSDTYIGEIVNKKPQEKQPMKVKPAAKTVTASKLKKSNVKIKNAITVKKNQGSVTYKKISGSKYLSISKKGIITVKKGNYKKGTVLKIKVKVTANGNSKYKKESVNVTVKVKIK